LKISRKGKVTFSIGARLDAGTARTKNLHSRLTPSLGFQVIDSDPEFDSGAPSRRQCLTLHCDSLSMRR